MNGAPDQAARNAGHSHILPTRLDVGTVARAATDLRVLAGAALQLDAGAVTHLGGLGLELLLRAEGDWRRAALPFSISPRSVAFDTALADFGIDPVRFDPARRDQGGAS
ncbi:MAG TPA: hypothetical protein VGC31_00275 [Paenirhodobacter sp.]